MAVTKEKLDALRRNPPWPAKWKYGFGTATPTSHVSEPSSKPHSWRFAGPERLARYGWLLAVEIPVEYVTAMAEFEARKLAAIALHCDPGALTLLKGDSCPY